MVNGACALESFLAESLYFSEFHFFNPEWGHYCLSNLLRLQKVNGSNSYIVLWIGHYSMPYRNPVR